MFITDLEEKHITSFDIINRRNVQNFLEQQGLEFDQNIQYTIAIFEGEKVIATGSFDHAVLKCIAIAPEYKGFGLTNKMISELINEQYRRGFEHLFVYTKPENEAIFLDLGFYKIMEVPEKVILLENSADGISQYVKEIETYKIQGDKIASLVMNCNPFTLGHRYLIEQASKENDVVHIFIVAEDRSYFSTATRNELVREGTKDLQNVHVHEGSNYMISAATFPSYFLKESSEVVETHAILDLLIFSQYIAPALGIHRRFVGEELTCPVTKEYNRIMKGLLPQYGIEVVEIPRLQMNGFPISASRVRQLLENENYAEIKAIVPETTYDYLMVKYERSK